MSNKVNIRLPTGRVVQGNFYTPNDKDFDGNPLVIKRGPKAGQPTVQYYFAVAIPKTPGAQAFWQEPWGQQLLNVGAQAHPQTYQRADFSWKVIDGDSAVPNKKNSIPNQQEGFPGHWVVRFTSGFAPKCYTIVGLREAAPLTVKDGILAGYYVQVYFNIEGNGNPNNPGIYVNPDMVCLVAYGEPIISSPDVSAAGFTPDATLPPGASLTPPVNVAMPVQPPAVAMAPQPSYAAPPPPAMAPPVAAPMPTPAPAVTAPPVPQPVAVVPNPGIMTVPVAPPPPGMAPPPPAAALTPDQRLTAKAGGVSYASFLAQGWTDATLIQNGYMVP